MKAEQQWITWDISESLLPAMLNGDTGHLTDREIEQIKDWHNNWEVTQLRKPDTYQNWKDECEKNEPSFTTCEVTGLLANCVKIQSR